MKNNSFHGFSKHLLDLLEEDITAESLNDISGIRQTTTTSLAHHTARRKATENGNVNKKSYLRRKSCHCTDCGGISKFEDLTKHIVVDLPRSHKTAAARLKTPPQAERRSKSHTSLAPTFNMRERRSTISKINASKLLLKKNISNGPELTSPEISKIKVRKSTKRGQSLPALDLLCDPESNSQVEPICSLNSINEETNCESKPVNAVISQEQDHTKLRDSNAQGSSDTAQETKNVDDKELSQTKPLKSLDKSPRSKSGQKTVMQTVIEENLKEAELASSRRGSRDNSLITSQKIAIEQQPSKTGFQRSDIADSKERLKKIQSSFSQYSTPKNIQEKTFLLTPSAFATSSYKKIVKSSRVGILEHLESLKANRDRPKLDLLNTQIHQGLTDNPQQFLPEKPLTQAMKKKKSDSSLLAPIKIKSARTNSNIFPAIKQADIKRIYIEESAEINKKIDLEKRKYYQQPIDTPNQFYIPSNYSRNRRSSHNESPMKNSVRDSGISSDSKKKRNKSLASSVYAEPSSKLAPRYNISAMVTDLKKILNTKENIKVINQSRRSNSTTNTSNLLVI